MSLSAMLQQPVVIPAAVYIIWAITLAIAVFIILPVTLLQLHRTLSAARNVERYLAEMRAAGMGIAKNTSHIRALDETTEVAGQILQAAASIKDHTETVETTLVGRAKGNGSG